MDKQGYLNNINLTGGKFDTFIEWMLFAMLAFMPFAFGVVQAWSEQVVITFAFAIILCFALKLILCPDTALSWFWVLIPVLLFLLIPVIQLIPMPTALISRLSGNTASVKTELLGGLTNQEHSLDSMTLSFYPNATKHDLRLVLSIVAVFFVVLNVFRRPEQIKRLLMAIIVVGSAVMLLALAQDITNADKIYWTIPIRHSAYSGPFVNHSNYAQFMNLSIGAAIGLLFVKLSEVFHKQQLELPVILQYLTSPSGRVIWYILAMIILGAATIFVSMSRAGVISILIAASFVTLIFTSQYSLKQRGWIMVFIALGAFICVLYLGFDAVYDRLATLRDLHRSEGGRLQILKDIAVAWTKFPMFGTGLGTHEVVYPMFDRSTIAALAAHAENEYAQAAEETGIMGLGSLIIFAIIIWHAFVRNIRNVGLPICSAVYGLGFGLLAIMIHSLSDFGQHLPANAVLSAVFCALLISLARMNRDTSVAPNPVFSRSGRVRLIGVSLFVLVIGTGGWAIVEANDARLAESHWGKALAVETELIERAWQGSNEEYIELIKNAAAAADYQPNNVKYRHWLNAYRWFSISRTLDPGTGNLVIPEPAMGFVSRIVDEYHKAITICPTFGPSWCVAGQLKKFILDDPTGEEYIRTGYRLAPCDPTACFVAGLLDVQQGNSDEIEESVAKFERAVQLDRRMFGDVAEVYINQLNRPDLALEISGEDIGRLSRVANILANSKEHNELTNKASQKVVDLLKLKCQQPDAAAWSFASLANIYKRQDENIAAIDCYRRALDLDYGQVYWRLELARLLTKTEQIPEAIHEARICLRLQSEFKAAESLIAQLSLHPAAVE